MISVYLPKAFFRDVLGYGSRIPIVRETLTLLHFVRHWHHPYVRRHPIDLSYAINTSGFMPSWLLRSGGSADKHAGAYVGCQPSCLRRALATISQPQSWAFLDLGCGKGRALVLASELPFRRIIGVELASTLVRVARRNARIVRKNYPHRTAIEVVEGDASAVPLPEGNLVIFLYQPFGPELVARMLSRITDAVSGDDREIYIIYENPVHAVIVDDTPGFTRSFCETVRCVASEIGFAPDDEEMVIIWRSGGTPTDRQHERASAPINIVKFD